MAEQSDAETSQPQYARRGSKGTIDMLVQSRRIASDEYARAQRAERAYRARKNATIARNSLHETKTHFAEGFKHLGLGVKGLIAVVKGAPYILGERRDGWRKRREAKQRERAQQMRKRLDERLARKSSEDEGSGKAPEEEGGEEKI
ncbi:hypothetical protein EV127DRAFT_476766 [Xylaria flabelliformis]|nr:hypothetical protein EV127DRAFT_476766 [Xylaria flabelliformis]